MKWTYKAAAALIAAGAAVFTIYGSGGTEQKAVLGGKVVSAAAVGTAVKAGDPLVLVETLAGPVPAAKATADGVVKEVRVQKGDMTSRDEVVAVLETR